MSPPPSPSFDPDTFWAVLTDEVFSFRTRHGTWPGAVRVSPHAYYALARTLRTFRLSVAGVPLQPDSSIPSDEDFELDHTRPEYPRSV